MTTLSDVIVDDVLNQVDLLDSEDLTLSGIEKILEYSRDYYLVDIEDRDIFTKLTDSLYCISLGELDTENHLFNLLNHIGINYEVSLNDSMDILNVLMRKYYDKVEATYKGKIKH